MNAILELILSCVLAASGQVSWRMGLRDVGSFSFTDINTMLKAFMNWQVDLGIILYGLSTIFWLSALSKKELSFAYPFIAGTYILVLLLSFLVLKENFGLTRVLGALVVLTGLAIIIKG